jgi:hypothetical protein
VFFFLAPTFTTSATFSFKANLSVRHRNSFTGYDETDKRYQICQKKTRSARDPGRLVLFRIPSQLGGQLLEVCAIFWLSIAQLTCDFHKNNPLVKVMTLKRNYFFSLTLLCGSYASSTTLYCVASMWSSHTSCLCGVYVRAWPAATNVKSMCDA